LVKQPFPFLFRLEGNCGPAEIKQAYREMGEMKKLWTTVLVAIMVVAIMVPSVSAMDGGKSEPNRQLTIAEAVTLIVEKFELSLAHMTFIKVPEATDYFTGIANDASYAEAFVIAHLNGLPLDKDVNPNDKITKEQFAHLVQHAVDSKGEFAYIMLFILIADEDDINPEYMGSVQKMLISGFMSLDKDGKFHPKRPVYRNYAIDVIDRALEFVREQSGWAPVPAPEEDELSGEARIKVEKVTEEVNKVTVSRVVPHPGYGLRIDRIEFTPDMTAIIYYTVTDPDPDMMYPQVISEAYAETYVSSQYTPEAKPAN